MKKYLTRVGSVLKAQRDARPYDDIIQLRLQRAMEELGEVAKAYRDYQNGKTPSPADLIEETVDSTICGLALFVAAGGKLKDFETLFIKKTKKWHDNIKAKKD